MVIMIFNLLPSLEWHSDSQDPQVHDEPAASEEANGKVLHCSALFIVLTPSWTYFPVIH